MDDLEKRLISELKNYFQDRVSDFCSKPAIGFPPAINVEFTAYRYLLAEVEVERNTAFFGVREGKTFISLLKTELLSLENNPDGSYLKQSALENLDYEIRLRIPDKYLEAKGWA